MVEQVAALEACADALLEAGDREVAVQLLEKLADLPGVGEYQPCLLSFLKCLTVKCVLILVSLAYLHKRSSRFVAFSVALMSFSLV